MDLPKTSQKVELRVLYGPYAGAYSTYAEGVEENSITVGHPMLGGTLIPMQPGDMVRLEYSVAGSARVAFPTRIQALENLGSPCVRLSMPEKGAVERYQQRDFVRLETNLPVTYRVIHAPDEDRTVRPDASIHSYTRDISGSGAQVMCSEPYLPGTQLDLRLDVAGTMIHVMAEVIRQTQQISPREHWMALRFLGLSERDRDQIIRYIFNEQLSRRRRGLL